MAPEDRRCPFCETEREPKMLFDDLFQCVDCGKIFDILDPQPEPKKDKPKRNKWEDGDE